MKMLLLKLLNSMRIVLTNKWAEKLPQTKLLLNGLLMYNSEQLLNTLMKIKVLCWLVWILTLSFNFMLSESKEH